MPHALTEIQKFVIEPKSLIDPSVDIDDRIMVTKFVGGGMCGVCPVPDLPERLCDPSLFITGVVPGWKKILPSGHQFFNRAVICPQKLRHGIMQNDIMLVISL